ncbi:MAG: M24 family metallopeptidase [Vampirovibrionia bacterium]
MKQDNTHDQRLSVIREEMNLYSLDALIVSSKDHYLNEYVDKNFSTLVYLSGFDGTTGNLLITKNEAYILVDGRYHTQAEKQVSKELYTIEKVGIDEEGNRITEYLSDRLIKVIERLAKKKNYVIGYDPYQTSYKTLEYLKNKLDELNESTVLTAITNSLEDKLFTNKMVKPSEITVVPEKIAGLSVQEKINQVKDYLETSNINGYFISALDEVSYITNLRSNEIPFNSTIKGFLFLTLDKSFMFVEDKDINNVKLNILKDYLSIHSLNNLSTILYDYIKSKDDTFILAYDNSSISCAVLDKLNQLISKQCKLFIVTKNPIKVVKANKNSHELNYIKECMNKSDITFDETIKWVKNSIKNKQQISEKDLQNRLENNFNKNNALNMSFSPICAAGINSAIIHYTHANDKTIINQNDLVLIDSGAYYEYGYATDLTRTILAGVEPTSKQKELYTLVLKASIAGLTAELPPETNGYDLDKIVRSVITEKNYDFNHGTGHGIGILVHESPPVISFSVAGEITLEEGMVFSIEPGIYIENWGGIRIENIATIKKHSIKEKADKGWHEIECLTFAPLDKDLINFESLTTKELDFLKFFEDRFNEISKGNNEK